MKRYVLVLSESMTVRAAVAQLLASAGYGVELADTTKRARELVAAGGVAAAIVSKSLHQRSEHWVQAQLYGRIVVLPDEIGDTRDQSGKAAGLQVQNAQSLLMQLSELLPIRQSVDDSEKDFRFEGGVIDFSGRTFHDSAGREVALTRLEFQLLAALARQPRQVLSRDQLRNAVTGGSSEAFDRSIDVLVARLRRKVERDPKSPCYIVTVPGEGYKFAARALPDAANAPLAATASERGVGEASIRVLPYPSIGSLFKGRDDFLMRLHDSLARQEGGRAAIVSKALYGLGGIGKTRAIVEYAHRYQAAYRAILFVIANSPEALRHNLAALTAPMALDLPHHAEAEQELRLRAVIAWLNDNADWLLILDNLDSKEAMSEAHAVMARLSRGHVVITTRLSAFAPYIEPIEIDVLTSTDAVDFLLQRTERHRRRTDDDAMVAKDLVDDVGGLAIALEQAGAFIDKGRLSFAQYRALWRANWPRVAAWADETVTHYPYAVAVTWETSIERVSEPARRLLARFAWLAPEPIPYFLLETAIAEPDVPQPCRPEGHFAALDDLAAYSMVRCEEASADIRVHRLVQDVARRSLDEPVGRAVLTETLQWITAAFAGDQENPQTRARLDGLTLHARTLLDHAAAADLDAAGVTLMGRLGDFLVSKALYAEARPLLERALSIDEGRYGPDHPQTALRLISLVILHQGEGDIVEAHRLAARALAIRETALGPEHPETAVVLNNFMGGLVRALGDLTAARGYCERALRIREKVLGLDHPDTARSLNDLSSVLRVQGDLAGARLLCERALAIREKTLGPQHVDTARSLTSVALLRHAEGDLAGARELHERAFAIRERVFGPEHPLTARSLNNLARVLQDQGNLARARTLYVRALAIREKILGSEHIDTAMSLADFATLFALEGDLAEARRLQARALAIREKVLGPGHPDTVKIRDELQS